MDKQIRNVVGPRIKLYREKKGITQEQLSARLFVQGIEVDRPMVSKIESQTREILDYEIYAISKVLDIDLNDLFEDISY